MEAQTKKIFNDLLSSKEWKTWAVAGVLALIAVVLKPLLFLAALIFFARALYLAWPELSKKVKNETPTV